MESTRISDLPDNVTMSAFPGAGNGRESHDRGHDMSSSAYRQMNPHQNPFVPYQNNEMMAPPNQSRGPIPPSYDYEQGPLGNSPQFPLPPKDIPLDTSNFRDESAVPNYIPRTQSANYVEEHESRIKTKRQLEPLGKQSDWLASLQVPIIVGLLYLVFQSEFINVILSRYFKSAGLFTEIGTLNFTGSLVKSVLFAAAYYSITKVLDSVDEF
jgi:hypothetical protein